MNSTTLSVARTGLMVCLLSAAVSHRTRALPRVVWASDPVLPGETVVMIGEGFGADTAVRIGRAVDGAPGEPVERTSAEVKDWQTVKPLQVSAQSAKFAVPAAWQLGVFVCQAVGSDGAASPDAVNAPDPWWLQGDRGESCSPGGWLRVFGKSLNFGDYGGERDAPDSKVFLRFETNEAVLLTPTAASCYALTVALPADITAGRATVYVHNGFGGHATWRRAGVIDIRQGAPWPAEIFDVKELGLQAALKKAAENRGGIVYFPRGRYLINPNSPEAIVVPDNTVLRGEGMDLVNLYWRDMDEPPLALVSGRNFAVEDLSIYCQNYFRGVIRTESGSDGFRMRRVRVHADPFLMFVNREKGREFRSRVLRCELSETGHALFLPRATNFEVTDCDILIGQLGILVHDGRNGLIARNKSFGNGCFAFLGFDRLIAEDNNLPGGELCGKGCIWIDEGAGTRATNFYCANNRIANAPFGDRELFTFDSANRVYDGKVAKVEGVRITLAGDPAPDRKAPRPPWPGCAIAIFAGRGRGQYRRVVAADGRQWEVDRPWDIPPDGTSQITIVPLRNHTLFVGNHLSDGGATQAYAVAMDSIFAENTFARTDGAGLGGGYCVNLGCQMLDNRISVGNAWGQRTAAFRVLGGRGDGSSPGSIASLFRRNRIDSNGTFYIQQAATDVLVERCTIADTDRGMRIDALTSQVLLRHNVFRNVRKPITGDGLKQAVVIRNSPP